jgi:hypothetical protein
MAAGAIGGSTYGVAKGITMVSLRVYDCNGRWAADPGDVQYWIHQNKPNGPDVIFYDVTSWAPGSSYSPWDLDIKHIILDDGISVVTPASDDNEDACDYSPGKLPAAITVGPTDRSDTKAPFRQLGQMRRSVRSWGRYPVGAQHIGLSDRIPQRQLDGGGHRHRHGCPLPAGEPDCDTGSGQHCAGHSGRALTSC